MRQVALQAVDLVLGDVLGVHEDVVVDARQVALAVVAERHRSGGTSPLPRITSPWQLMQSTPFS